MTNGTDFIPSIADGRELTLATLHGREPEEAFLDPRRMYDAVSSLTVSSLSADRLCLL